MIIGDGKTHQLIKAQLACAAELEQLWADRTSASRAAVPKQV
jgi:hypothetical protein